VSLAVAVAAVTIGLAGPASYTLATVTTAHAGAIPSAGPAVAGGLGGGPRGGFAGGGPGGPGGAGAGGAGGPGGAGAGGAGGPGGPGGGGRFAGGSPGGAAGGLLNGSNPTAALTSLLKQGSANYTWVAAAVGSNTAAGYQLATSSPVMAIGGFNGTDPSPTLAEFQRYVAEGQIHYFIGGGRGGGGLGGPSGATGGTASQISAWVTSHFSSQTVGGVTIYDLTQAPTAS
jgi:hypothetical protein